MASLTLTEPPQSHLISCTVCNYSNGIYRTECYRCGTTLPHINKQYQSTINTVKPLVTDTIPYRDNINTLPQSAQSVPSTSHTATQQYMNQPMIYNDNISSSDVLQTPTNNPIRTPTHNRVYYNFTQAAGRPSSVVAHSDRGKRAVFNFDNTASQQIDHLKYYSNGLGHLDPTDIKYQHHTSEPQFPYQRNEQLETHVDEHKYNGIKKQQSENMIPPSVPYTSQPLPSTTNKNVRFDDVAPLVIGDHTATEGTQTNHSAELQTNSPQPMYHQSLQSTPVTSGQQPVPVQSITTSYQPTVYDLQLYGRDLSEKVSTYLLQRGGIYYKRSSGWSTGLFYNRLYGWLYMVLYNGEIHYELSDRIIYQTFSEYEFKSWLSEQSDWSLSGHELGNEFFMKGRVNRKLLYSAINEASWYPIH